MPVEHQAPDVVAMILADNILRDVSDKFYIQGTYNLIFSKEFPFIYPITLYIALTDGYGETPIRIRLVDVNEARPPVFENELTVKFPDPLTVAELTCLVRMAIFPEPGEYRIQLYGAGQFLRERRLQVVAIPTQDDAK
jgi:hypothetical protein